jgi:hypothetical protein
MYTLRHIGRIINGVHINCIPCTSFCYLILKLVDGARKKIGLLFEDTFNLERYMEYIPFPIDGHHWYTFFQQDFATAYTAVAFVLT